MTYQDMSDKRLIEHIYHYYSTHKGPTELARRFKDKCDSEQAWRDQLEAQFRDTIEMLKARVLSAGEELAKAREELEGNCPMCDNTGCYATQGTDGEPEPNQCEWCYTIPYSKFNRNRFESLHSELTQAREEIERLKDEVTKRDEAIAETMRRANIVLERLKEEKQ
jgi:hypothetical protein